MPVEALALALLAACLHALWNVLLAGAKDPETAAAVALPVSVIAFAPAAVLVWEVERAAIPYVAASSALHFAYFALLMAAYRRADLTIVYPLSRGLAPVLVLGVAVGLLGTATSPLQVAGVLLVATGVLLVRGVARHSRPRGVVFAVAIAGCIAAYTLVDKEGMEHAAPVPYLELVLVPGAAVYLGLIATLKGARTVAGELRASTAVAGLATFAAYALVLAALAIAPAAPVAAVRETSVVIGTALAAVLLRERVGALRLAGSAVVVAGIMALAVG